MKRNLMALCLVVSGACGGDEGGGSEGGGGGGPADGKKGSELSAAEREELCKFRGGLQSEGLTLEQICTFTVARGAESKEECEEQRASCIKLTEPPDTSAEATAAVCAEDVESGGLALEGCTATVAELKACMRDASAEELRVFKGASCDMAGAPVEPKVPASCSKLPDECQSVLFGS